ncbi:MAG TPA: hypothetical protein VE057_04500 [Archangium sp.]|jgi:hypothetical protein|nr:hypothetical protein [Archangium sp.]
MRILSLSFGRAARTPSLSSPGLALTVTREPERDRGLVLYGACRASKAALPVGKLALPAGVQLVGIHLPTQHAASINLVGQRLVFDEDVEQEGNDFVARFRCVLDPSTSMPGPFCLHASFRQYVSDIFWAEP